MLGLDLNTDIQIEQFLLAQTGTYQQVTQRPFTVNVDQNSLSALESATRGGHHLGISAVQNVAGNIIRPQADIEGYVNIPNGWSSRRFRFLMKVVERHPFSTNEVTQRFFFGYTDQCDVSHGNLLDPNMRIFFNSETVVTRTVRMTPNGPVPQVIINAANQIVSPVDYTAGGLMHHQQSRHLQRPEDMFNYQHSKLVADTLRKTGKVNGEIMDVIDTRSIAGNGGQYQYSHRRDTSPTRYLSDLLTGYQNAAKEAKLGMGGMDCVDHNQVLSEATNFTANQNIQLNAFLGRLRQERGYMEKGYVTFQELCASFPEAGDYNRVTRAAMDNGQSIRQVNHVDSAMHWNGADDVSIAANMLAQVVPSIMMDNYLRNISFAVTNGVGPGQYRLDFHEQNIRYMIDGVSMIPALQEFERRLIVDALNTLTHGNQIPFRISMATDLVGDSVIDIELGAEGLRRYVAPTFSDSLFTPLVTNHRELVIANSDNVRFLVDSVIPLSSNDPAIMNQMHTNFGFQQQQPVTVQNQGANNDYSGLL